MLGHEMTVTGSERLRGCRSPRAPYGDPPCARSPSGPLRLFVPAGLL